MTGERAILNSGLWAAYGDALGFTTEMAGESLVQRRIGSKRIERVVTWSRRVGGRFGPQIDLPGGTYSDDTQLRVATSRAIRGDSHFDVEIFSKVELPVWLSYELGGGRGTKIATKNLARQDVAWYSNFFKTGGSSYVHAGGNGAAMRIQPHVWASPVHPLSAETKLDIVMNSLCTHGHLRGVGGALFHSACLSFCLSEKHAPGLPQLLDFASSLRHLPKIIAQQDHLATIWLPTWEQAAGVGLADAANQLSAEVSEMLQVAGGYVGTSDCEEAYHRLLGALKGREEATRGSGTKTAILAAVLAWIMRDEGVERALQVAANTLGSDTDTIATMTGAIMGVISADQPETVQDRDYLCQEANRLYLLSQRESTDSFGYPDLLNWRAPSSQVDGVGRLDGALGLAGLGRAEEAGPLFPATSKHNMRWQWLNLDFGQSIVAKRRAEPRALRASQLPVGRVLAGKTPLRKQRKEIMEPVPRKTASGGQQTSLFVDDVQTDPQGRPLVSPRGAGMRTSAKTIERLIEIITGNTEKSPYRSDPQLIEFFRDFGERDLYGQGFPTGAYYVQEKLREFNGTETMKKLVSSAFDFFGEDGFDPEEQAEAFNRLLVRDGYRLVIEYRSGWMEGDRYVGADPYFDVQPVLPAAILPEGLATINHNAVNEQISKANQRIATGDFAGAIASSYTLTEHLLKLILCEAGVALNENEGDIRALYKLVREPLNLNPAGEGIAAPLKPILDGFQKLISGLYEISNKASDRHARRYNPAAHHAKLAVNAAFALCAFLVESRDYQGSRDAHSTGADAQEAQA